MLSNGTRALQLVLSAADGYYFWWLLLCVAGPSFANPEQALAIFVFPWEKYHLPTTNRTRKMPSISPS